MPSTFSLFALASVVSTAVYYAFFSRKSKHDDEEQQSLFQPSPSPSVPNSHTQETSDHRHHYSSPTPTTHTANYHSTPSASTHAQPSYHSYQQPRIEPRTVQATASTKENPESSHHVHRHGLASHSQTAPTSASQAQIPHLTQSTASSVRPTTSTTSDHLDPLHRTSLTSSDALDSRLTPSIPALSHTSYTAQQASVQGAQTTTRTPTRTDYDNSLHRSDFDSSSSVWESYQTTPTRTHASYPAQQTSARVSQFTSTPPRTDYESSLHRSDFASLPVWESRQTPSTPTRTHALYSTQRTSTGVVGTTVRTPTVADYDDMGPSPYSYLRTPSPDRTRVSRLTVSQKHSRTQSSSSDSDYLGPNTGTRAAPRSRGHEVRNAIADAKDRKKAMELREQAKRSARDMLDARDRAKIAHRRGDHEAEDEYGQEARSHESLKKNSDKRAAKILFRMNNKTHEEGTVDLHDLYVAEAVEFAKEELQSAMYRNDDRVVFIVGQGRHSDDGVPKLRPALEELFDERRLRYSLDPGNAGKLIVYLD